MTTGIEHVPESLGLGKSMTTRINRQIDSLLLGHHGLRTPGQFRAWLLHSKTKTVLDTLSIYHGIVTSVTQECMQRNGKPEKRTGASPKAERIRRKLRGGVKPCAL